MDILFEKYIYIKRDQFFDERAIVIFTTTPPIVIKKNQRPLLMNHAIKKFLEADSISQKNGSNGFVAICYLENLKKCKLPIKFYITFAKLLKSMFMNKLYQCILINAPPIFKNIYFVIKGFIDKNTRKKLIFMKNDEEIKDFLED